MRNDAAMEDRYLMNCLLDELLLQEWDDGTGFDIRSQNGAMSSQSFFVDIELWLIAPFSCSDLFKKTPFNPTTTFLFNINSNNHNNNTPITTLV